MRSQVDVILLAEISTRLFHVGPKLINAMTQNVTILPETSRYWYAFHRCHVSICELLFFCVKPAGENVLSIKD